MKKQPKKEAKYTKETFYFEHSQIHGLRLFRVRHHSVRGYERRCWSAKRLLSIFRQGVHDGWIK